jgi:hypothetical protein
VWEYVNALVAVISRRDGELSVDDQIRAAGVSTLDVKSFDVVGQKSS